MDMSLHHITNGVKQNTDGCGDEQRGYPSIRGKLLLAILMLADRNGYSDTESRQDCCKIEGRMDNEKAPRAPRQDEGGAMSEVNMTTQPLAGGVYLVTVTVKTEAGSPELAKLSVMDSISEQPFVEVVSSDVRLARPGRDYWWTCEMCGAEHDVTVPAGEDPVAALQRVVGAHRQTHPACFEQYDKRVWMVPPDPATDFPGVSWEMAFHESEALRDAAAAAPRGPQRNEWRLDEVGALDDVVVDAPEMIRLERMGHDHVWGAVYHRDGSRTVFNVWGDRGARVSLTHEHEPIDAQLFVAGAARRGGRPLEPLLDRIEAEIRDGHYSMLRLALAQRGPAGVRITLEELAQLVRSLGTGPTPQETTTEEAI